MFLDGTALTVTLDKAQLATIGNTGLSTIQESGQHNSLLYMQTILYYETISDGPWLLLALYHLFTSPHHLFSSVYIDRFSVFFSVLKIPVVSHDLHHVTKAIA